MRTRKAVKYVEMFIEDKINCEFSWVIKNYIPEYHDWCGKLNSPSFFADSSSGVKWNLSLILPESKYDDIKSPKDYYISCFLKRSENGGADKRVMINFTLEIITLEQKVLCSFPFKQYGFTKGNYHVCYRFVKYSELWDIWKNGKDFIVRCHLSNMEQAAEMRRYWVETNIGFNKQCIHWEIGFENTASWSKRKLINSIEQSPLDVCVQTLDENLLVTINKVTAWPLSSQFLICSIKFLNRDGKICKVEDNSNLFIPVEVNKIWKFSLSVTESDIRSLVNDFSMNRITLIFEFYITNGIITEDISSAIQYHLPSEKPLCVIQHLNTLFSEMKKLNLGRNNCDLSFRTDNRLFPVHEHLLRTRAEEWWVLNHEQLDTTRCFEITDINSITFTLFLNFLYTGSLTNIVVEDVLKLFEVAHRFLVEDLRDLCANWLRGNVTNNNVFKILVIAVKSGYTSLEEHVYNFIKENKDVLFGSSQYNHFIRNHTKMANVMYRHVY